MSGSDTARPWLVRPEWRAGVIRRESDGGRVWLIVNVAAACAFAACVGYFAEGAAEGIAFGVFVGALMVFFALRRYRLDGRPGVSTFTFDRVPFILGQTLSGTLSVSNVALLHETRLMLGCWGRSSGSMTPEGEEEPEWHAMRAILPQRVRYVSGGAEMDVKFDLPADGRPTRSGLLPVRWDLAIVAGFPGKVPLARFRVPVFGPDAASLVQDTAVAGAKKRSLQRALSVFDE